jgi:IS30 family transposase
LGKHLSSVYRELVRNSEQGLYSEDAAQLQAEQRRAQSKGSPQMDNHPLMATVKAWFKKDYCPEQIAGQLVVPVNYTVFSSSHCTLSKLEQKKLSFYRPG